MNNDYYAFGEMLWDCLPTARHAGGAPFNVAAHLAQLGVSASLLSAIGHDALGDELLQLAQSKGIGTQFVGRARAGLATGTVQVTLDASSNASYEIVEPVAWDEIALSADALQAVRLSQALVFGSLAVRSPHNLAQLHRLLDLSGPMKFLDVNLRPPFADPARVLDIAQHADVIKLNEDELGLLAGWVEKGEVAESGVAAGTPPSMEALASDCTTLARATNTTRLCVTRGAPGAVFWDKGRVVSAAAPPVQVRDTIGAGDAFMAGLVVGLTRKWETARVLEAACRLGAYVAGQDGAAPALPPEIVQLFVK